MAVPRLIRRGDASLAHQSFRVTKSLGVREVSHDITRPKVRLPWNGERTM